MIHVQDISIQKGQHLIVKDASFHIVPGKISIVIGKNGAGKSTVLEALTGSLPFHNGSISWDGRSLSSFTTQTLATRRAVLSQQVSVGFPIRVSEMVAMGTYASPKPLLQTRVRHEVSQALQEVEMLDFLDRDFNTLSGGEQKRVLLAKCLVQLQVCQQTATHQYLFLDEPTSNLDIQQQYKILHLVQKLVSKHNLGVFAVLHDLNLAAQFADHVILMRDGIIVHQGSPEKVLTTAWLKRGLDIPTVVQAHPVLDCVQIIPLPVEETQYSLTPIETSYL